MKEFIKALIVWILALLIGSLIFWGLGNLIIYVFHIDYTWTFLHGVVADLVWNLLKGLFSNNSKKEQ